MKKTFLLTTIVALSALFFSACSDDTTDSVPNPQPMSKTIVDVAVDNNFTILKAALDRVGLTATLEGEGPFTVFAPTDAAFEALLTELNANSLDDIDDATLTQVLLNHVVAGKVMSTDLSSGYVNSLASGAEETQVSILVDLSNGVMLNNRSKVTTPDVTADNGVIHVIDKVLLIPNVVDAALANSNFSILVEALTTSGLSTDFVSVLSADGPYTVFAPTNAAFEALLAASPDWNSLSDIPVETLEAVLKYHVIAGANVTASEITDGLQPETVLGSTITINTTNGVTITDGQSRNSSVIVADVQTSNGVIHAINNVLIP